MKKVKFLKPVTMALVLFFTFPALYAFAYVPFVDVADSHWAIKYITKMHLRGVVQGIKSGDLTYFKSDDPVTQIQAIAFAVRNRGDNEELNNTNALESYGINVPTWARNEASIALDEGLIVPAENRFQANENATRAWVAQLMVRMIGKDSEAANYTGSDLDSFSDVWNIPVWARGYVGTAVKYGLMNGYPDGTFKPNDSVKRAEMVKLLYMAEKYIQIEVPGMESGRIAAINGNTISISDNGQIKQYISSDLTDYFVGDSLAFKDSLQKGQEVTLINENNTIKYLEIMQQSTAETTVQGKVMQIFTTDNTVIILDENQQPKSLLLTPNTLFYSSNGTIIDLSDLNSGDQIEATIDALNTVTSISVLDSSGTAQASGIVYDIDKDNKLITLKTASGSIKPYIYDDMVEVIIQDRRFTGIEDIEPGDMVRIEAQNGHLSSITLVLSDAEASIKGEVVKISTQNSSIIIRKEDDSLAEYKLDSGTNIIIAGLNNSSINDLAEEDTIELSMEQGIIKTLKVLSRDANATLKATVIAVDNDNKVIVLQDPQGKLYDYTVSDKAEILVNNHDASLDEITKDMEIEVILLADEIVYLENDNSIEGTVTRIDPDRRILVLNLEKGGSGTYFLNSDVDVNIETISSPDPEDISNGDYVEITLNNEEKVTDIDVRSSVNYDITTVYTSSDKLKVEDEGGDSRYLYLDKKVDLIAPGIDVPEIEDFTDGDLIKATFIGNSIESIELMPITMGKITGINSFGNTITILTFAGESTEVKFDSKSKIHKGSSSYEGLYNLAVGDRVEIKNTIKEIRDFYVMEKVIGTFSFLNDDNDKVYLEKSPVEWTDYDLNEKVYLHQGTTGISTSSLKKGDRLNLYLLNDSVYEIEKIY